MPGKSFEEIVSIMRARREQNSPLLEEMLKVRARYNGEYVIPIPEMDDAPEMPPLTPALVAESVDNPALQAASVMPSVFCPPIDWSKDTGVRSRARARTREGIIYATWWDSKAPLLFRRFFRHLAGYATSTLLVRPDYRAAHPVIEARDPLLSYPQPKAAEDLSRPDDVGFIHPRSAGWLRSRFPNSAIENGGPIPAEQSTTSEMWDVTEWWDEDQVVWGVLGPSDTAGFSRKTTANESKGPSFLELARFVNKCGHCPCVSMNRVTMDRIASQVAHTTGIIDFMGKLVMLDMISAERNVFPDRYVIGRPGETPVIVSNDGEWVDGRTGLTNLVEGAQAIGELRSAGDPMTRMAYDTLERNHRVSTGNVPQFGGESGNINLRTGRAIDSMMGVAVDPRVQELQEIAVFGLAELNESILSTWRYEWGQDKVRLFTGWRGERSLIETTPATDIEIHDNAVSYAIPGADVQKTTIALGQLLGAEGISIRTLRRKHPWVEDPDGEEMQVDTERLERAAFESIMQKAITGELPLTYLQRIAEARVAGKSIFEAIAKANEELQAEQAEQAPPELQSPEGQAPEQMMGLEAPPPQALAGAPPGGPGGPAPGGPQIGPTQGQVGLAELANVLRSGNAPV